MIVAGFGFRAAASEASLADALERAGGSGTVAALATAEDKSAAPAIAGLARRLGLPVLPVAAKRIAAQAVPTRSAAALRHRGTGSLAEAAALAAAGRGARLVGPRAVSGDRMATCALAEGEGE